MCATLLILSRVAKIDKKRTTHFFGLCQYSAESIHVLDCTFWHMLNCFIFLFSVLFTCLKLHQEDIPENMFSTNSELFNP